MRNNSSRGHKARWIALFLAGIGLAVMLAAAGSGGHHHGHGDWNWNWGHYWAPPPVFVYPENNTNIANVNVGVDVDQIVMFDIYNAGWPGSTWEYCGCGYPSGWDADNIDFDFTILQNSDVFVGVNIDQDN